VISLIVTATFETDAVPQDKDDDAADDPAIWVNRKEPGKSVLFGTDKLGGLASYNLKGRQLHYYSTGKMNNCDIRYAFPSKRRFGRYPCSKQPFVSFHFNI
jgi:3-phytase